MEARYERKGEVNKLSFLGRVILTPPRKCTMVGEGMVILGIAPVDGSMRDCRYLKLSTSMGSTQRSCNESVRQRP